jgi:hypothetical protein
LTNGRRRWVFARLREKWVAPLILTTYVLWPVPEWGIVGGIPLGQFGVLALAGIWLGWAFCPHPFSWRLAAIFLAMKVIGGGLLNERGLVAEYYANSEWQPPMERSVEYRRAPFTRIDRSLDFGPQATTDLPLFFINDFLRFNFYQPGEPSRKTLPCSASWTGFFRDQDSGHQQVYLRGLGVSGEVAIDGVVLASLTSDQSRVTGTLPVRGGWRRVQVKISAPPNAGRTISAGIVDASGREHPFGDGILLTSRVSSGRLRVDRVVRVVAPAVDGLLLLWVAVAALRITSFGHLLWLVAVLEAWVFARPWAGRLMVLDGGSDPLTYETYARDILLHGPLMTMGQSVGTGGPFYYQPLYPYVLAAFHWVCGEGFFGVVFLQRLLVAVSVGLVWQITRALFGPRVGLTGACLAGVFLYLKVGPWAAVLLGEIAFIPLVCGWVLLLIRLAAGGRTAFWAGLLGALATLSRSTLLLAWPPALGLVALARRRTGSVLRAVGTASVVALAVVALATLRNWIVARQFVPITTSFSINLYLGNQPPVWLDTHGIDEFRFYRWVAREETTRKVLEFAVHAPGLFVRNLVNKALYTLGFFGALVAGAGVVPLLVVVWLLAALGAWLAWFRWPEDNVSRWERAIPGGVALAHFVAVVLIFPHVYVDRLILPFYVLILPYAAVALAAIISRVSETTKWAAAKNTCA